MTTSTPNSSWIHSFSYLPNHLTQDGATYLAIFLSSSDVALLYGGPTTPIPEWLPGLLAAGCAKESVGLAYSRLVKGKYAYTRVEGRERVRELRKMMP